MTDRLKLREAREEDAEDVYSFKSDPLVTSPYCVEPYSSVKQANDWIHSVLEGYRKKQHIMWMITLKDENRVIGDCTLWHLDLQSECGELGYELHRDYWNKGLASEAVSSVIKFGFVGMNLNRIEADPFRKNTSSSKLLERSGFKLEGNLRERFYFRGKFYDQLYYSLLKSEWFEH